MRIVVVSSGHAGLQFARELSGSDDVVVVHGGPEGRSELEKLDVELLEGSGNDPELLRRAGVAEADYVVACSHSDEVNLLACLTARRLGRAYTICYVGKQEYMRTLGGESGTAPELGIDRIVWPAQMLAEKIEKILAVPGAIDVGYFAGGRIGLLEYRLREGQPLVGRPLMEIRALPPGVLIAAVTRGDEWFVPRGQSMLAAGDRVLFMGRSDATHQLAAFFADNTEEAAGGDVVIVGGGTVAMQLALSMERNARARLKIIEVDDARCQLIAQTLKRTLILHGDGSDLELLEAERVRYARALVAVTDSDEKNLLCSLLGRQLGIPRVITRVSSAANRRVFERVGIDVPLSARGAATEAVLHMIRHKEVDLLATIGEGRGEVLEFVIPEGFAPRPLKEIALPQNSIVGAVARRSEAVVPGGATLIGPGDRCLVICKTEAVDDVRKAFTA